MDKILHRFMSCMAHDTTLTSPHTHSDFNIGGSLTHRKGTPLNGQNLAQVNLCRIPHHNIEYRGEEGHHAKGCGESHVRSLGELILGLCKILSINCWDHVFF